MNISSRTLTKSGAYLLGQAKKLARGLWKRSLRFSTARQVIDGYIVEGKRCGNVGSATVYDLPVYILLTGELRYNAPPLANTGRYGPLLMRLAQGRDALLAETQPAQSPGDQFGVAQAGPLYQQGTFPARSLTYYSGAGWTAQFVPYVAVYSGPSTMRSNTNAPINTHAFVNRDTYVVYDVVIHPQQLIYRTWTLTEGVWSFVDYVASGSVPFPAFWGLQISDSIMRSTYGALPFSIRVAPPTYDPNDPAQTVYAQAQAPWHSFVVERLPDEAGYPCARITVWAHAVVEMMSDADLYGARGLWVATFKFVGNTPSLEGQFLVDTRADAVTERQPYESSVGVAYAYNAHLRVGGSILADGTAVIFDPMLIRVTGTGNFMSMDVHWVNRAGSRTAHQVVLSAFPINSGPNDMHIPIGSATDGTIAVCVAFTTVFTDQPMTIDIIVADSSSATVELSQEVEFYPCLGATPVSRLTTGQLDNDHWGTVGAGGDQVRYMGNGKFIFYASTVVSFAFPGNGNWAAVIYNATDNELEVAGVIDPTLYPSTQPWTLGAIDVIVEEQADEFGVVTQPAVMLATRGGYVNRAGIPGTEAGQTWASWDSGATWSKIADYGSPSGTFYSGSKFNPRQEIIIPGG